MCECVYRRGGFLILRVGVGGCLESREMKISGLERECWLY